TLARASRDAAKSNFLFIFLFPRLFSSPAFVCSHIHCETPEPRHSALHAGDIPVTHQPAKYRARYRSKSKLSCASILTCSARELSARAANSPCRASFGG